MKRERFDLVQKSFSLTPKGESGDFVFSVTFTSQEGPGMVLELLEKFGPLNKCQVRLTVEPVQMRINTESGEVS